MTAAPRARIGNLIAGIALAASFAALGAESARSGGAPACFRATPGHTKVGAITRIFHTSVNVNDRYTRTAPCDLLDGDAVGTDSRGEAALRLSVRDQETKCAIFPLANVTVYPPSQRPRSVSRVVTFRRGRTWCSKKPGMNSSYTAGAGAAPHQLLSKKATFGVEVDRGTVLLKVRFGTVRVGPKLQPVGPNKMILVSPNGTITGPKTALLDATDRLALVRLR